MKTGWIPALSILALCSVGCSTVTLARLDRCTIQRTTTMTTQHEEVLFCDEDAPAWSSDRAVRLAQECLYQQRQMRREAMLTAVRLETAMPEMDEEAAKQCLPVALRTVQAENEALKDRLARADVEQARMADRHTELENGLTKALNRPINAVADARATSDSGADSRHGSEVVSHFNSDFSQAPPPVKRGVVAPKTAPAAHPGAPKKPEVAEAKNASCPVCPAPVTPSAAEAEPDQK